MKQGRAGKARKSRQLRQHEASRAVDVKRPEIDRKARPPAFQPFLSDVRHDPRYLFERSL
jgi:hypothetical protein